MNENLLLIFTRNPELGKVKTRLAKTVGNKKALEIYKFLLNKTKEISINTNSDKAVFYSVKVRENDIWDKNYYQKYQQEGKDLGERMLNAFKTSFLKGYKKVIIIGSDLYDLTSNQINEAFEKLNSHDFVIGPAKDGGYYLLGMKSLEPKIFKNKNWGSSSVRKETIDNLKEKSIFSLTELNDIDIYEDIEEHPAFQKFLI